MALQELGRPGITDSSSVRRVLASPIERNGILIIPPSPASEERSWRRRGDRGRHAVRIARPRRGGGGGACRPARRAPTWLNQTGAKMAGRFSGSGRQTGPSSRLPDRDGRAARDPGAVVRRSSSAADHADRRLPERIRSRGSCPPGQHHGLVPAKIAGGHHAPSSRNAPTVIGKVFEASVPRMTSPSPGSAGRCGSSTSQPGSRSAGKLSGENGGCGRRDHSHAFGTAARKLFMTGQ